MKNKSDMKFLVLLPKITAFTKILDFILNYY